MPLEAADIATVQRQAVKKYCFLKVHVAPEPTLLRIAANLGKSQRPYLIGQAVQANVSDPASGAVHGMSSVFEALRLRGLLHYCRLRNSHRCHKFGILVRTRNC